MSRYEKLKQKFYEKPIPNDITFNEVFVLASKYGCLVDNGGKHSVKIVHKESGTVIPIPKHGNTVGEAYIQQLKVLFDLIDLKEVHP